VAQCAAEGRACEGDTLVLCAAAERGLFLRDCNVLAEAFEGRYLRISVKDRETNGRMVGVLGEVLRVERVGAAAVETMG